MEWQGVSERDVVFMFAGGANLGDFGVAGGALFFGEGAESAPRDPPRNRFRLQRFVDSKCALINPRALARNVIGRDDPSLPGHVVPVRRRELTNYVAIKLGGAHYDPRRASDAERSLDLLRKGNVQIGEFGDPVLVELLAIGQAIAGSDGADKLLAALRERDGEAR